VADYRTFWDTEMAIDLSRREPELPEISVEDLPPRL
jgi:hypothetical protein